MGLLAADLVRFAPPVAGSAPHAASQDLLNPPADYEKQKHKLKRLVQSPNSFFMDVKCQARAPPLRRRCSAALCRRRRRRGRRCVEPP